MFGKHEHYKKQILLFLLTYTVSSLQAQSIDLVLEKYNSVFPQEKFNSIINSDISRKMWPILEGVNSEKQFISVRKLLEQINESATSYCIKITEGRNHHIYCYEPVGC